MKDQTKTWLLMASLALADLFCGGAAVHAQEAASAPADKLAVPRFGEIGQWVFSTDASVTLQRRTQSDTDGAVSSITLVPAADFFLFDNFSLGGFIGIEYAKAGESHGTRFSIGPRVGYNFFFAERWSIWPKVGISYAHTAASGGENQDALALNVFVPFAFHPVPHFLAGFGPFVDTDMNGDNRATVWGGKLTLGGWL